MRYDKQKWNDICLMLEPKAVCELIIENVEGASVAFEKMVVQLASEYDEQLEGDMVDFFLLGCSSDQLAELLPVESVDFADGVNTIYREYVQSEQDDEDYLMSLWERNCL